MRLKSRRSLTLLCCSLAAPICLTQASMAQPARPAITGVSHLAVYASDMSATDRYYTQIIGLVAQPDPENKQGKRYMVNATQFVEVLPIPPNAGKNRMDHTAYITDSAEGMRAYLAAKGYKTPAKIESYSDGSKAFRVNDPEGIVVEFLQLPPNPTPVDAPNAPGHHIIHVGFILHDRAKEDSFYQGLLGFRPYWYGGMTDAKVEWVSEQTPDSRDWMEYMVRSEPGLGIPETMTEAVAGILNHFSIGVVSIQDAYKMLAAGNRLTGHVDPAPKVGRDGKYQLNMYDPDGTRVELMEFKAVEKPCCSPFTATDPNPVK